MSASPDIVEAVAQAIAGVQGGLNYDYIDFCRDAARAAIAAYLLAMPEAAHDLAARKIVNRYLGELLAPLMPDICERIRVGNATCSLILADLAKLPAKREDVTS